MRRVIIGVIAAVIAIAGLIITEPWTYFVVNEVDEAFPGLSGSQRDAVGEMPDEMPDEPVVLHSGSFITIDPIHGAEGTAVIYELPDGSRVLRFEDFRSSNGPDLHVYLSSGVPKSTFAGLGEDAIHLGSLKGNVGSQNYDIPANANLAQYQSVVIYCMPFRVVFSSAELS